MPQGGGLYTGGSFLQEAGKHGDLRELHLWSFGCIGSSLGNERVESFEDWV